MRSSSSRSVRGREKASLASSVSLRPFRFHRSLESLDPASESDVDVIVEHGTTASDDRGSITAS